MNSSHVFVTILAFINFASCMGKENSMDNTNVNININVNTELKREVETMRQKIARLTKRQKAVEDMLSGNFVCLQVFQVNEF